jgi:hypothetical protein
MEQRDVPETTMPGSEDLLALAGRHVDEARLRVVQQTKRVEKLRRAGHDTTEAERLLWNFENTLRSMFDHLEFELKQDRKRAEGRIK